MKTASKIIAAKEKELADDTHSMASKISLQQNLERALRDLESLARHYGAEPSSPRWCDIAAYEIALAAIAERAAAPEMLTVLKRTLAWINGVPDADDAAEVAQMIEDAIEAADSPEPIPDDGGAS